MQTYNSELLNSLLRGKSPCPALIKAVESAEYLQGGLGGAVSPATIIAIAAPYVDAPVHKTYGDEEGDTEPDTDSVPVGTRMSVVFENVECEGVLSEPWTPGTKTCAKVKINGDNKEYRLIREDKILSGVGAQGADNGY